MLISVHPHTASRMDQSGLKPTSGRIQLLKPLGFFDFVKLEKNAGLVISDSGTVQEECAIFGIRNVTLRDVTERPETIECGSNILSGGNPEDLLRTVQVALSLEPQWVPPAEYTVRGVAQTVCKIALGYSRAPR
jgi:UDP-N-acetylglucosamine 2-epimerase (non-hydrolysing)